MRVGHICHTWRCWGVTAIQTLIFLSVRCLSLSGNQINQADIETYSLPAQAAWARVHTSVARRQLLAYFCIQRQWSAAGSRSWWARAGWGGWGLSPCCGCSASPAPATLTARPAAPPGHPTLSNIANILHLICLSWSDPTTGWSGGRSSCRWWGSPRGSGRWRWTPSTGGCCSPPRWGTRSHTN